MAWPHYSAPTNQYINCILTGICRLCGQTDRQINKIKHIDYFDTEIGNISMANDEESPPQTPTVEAEDLDQMSQDHNTEGI